MSVMVADFYAELIETLPKSQQVLTHLSPADPQQMSLIGFLHCGWVFADWKAEDAARWLITACQRRGMPAHEMRALLRELHDMMRETTQAPNPRRPHGPRARSRRQGRHRQPAKACTMWKTMVLATLLGLLPVTSQATSWIAWLRVCKEAKAAPANTCQQPWQALHETPSLAHCQADSNARMTRALAVSRPEGVTVRQMRLAQGDSPQAFLLFWSQTSRHTVRMELWCAPVGRPPAP